MQRNDKESGGTTGHRTANRVLDILELLSSTPDGFALKDISRQLDAPKSSLLPLLMTLCDRGYISQDYHGVYRLGTRLLEISTGVNRQMNLRDIAHPELRALAVKTGESVILSRLTTDAGAVVYIDKVETFRRARATAAVGDSRPLHSTSSGKLLLAFMPEARMTRIVDQLEMMPYTEYTVTRKEELLSEIREIRGRGYALAINQSILGVCSIAAPIRDREGEVIAACVLSGPVERIGDSVPVLVKEVMATASLISRQLGYRKAETGSGHRKAPASLRNV